MKVAGVVSKGNSNGAGPRAKSSSVYLTNSDQSPASSWWALELSLASACESKSVLACCVQGRSKAGALRRCSNATAWKREARTSSSKSGVDEIE